MKKMINKEIIEGRVYEHELKVKTVQNKDSQNYGTEYITGTLSIATDEEGLNIIPIHFTYVTKTTKAGNDNITYSVLDRIINEDNCWVKKGKEEAFKVRANTALSVNDFYGRDGNLVSNMINEGGFVTIINSLKDDEAQRAIFSTDIVIIGVNHVEEDKEKGIDNDFTKIRGAIFNFRNALLPVTFIVRDPNGMKYFEDLDVTATEPFFTKVEGNISNNTITKIEYEENAFGGEPVARKTPRKNKEWVINWAAPKPPEFGEEGVITIDEFKQAIQDREVHLAEVKKNHDEYIANKNASSTSAGTGAATITVGGFKF